MLKKIVILAAVSPLLAFGQNKFIVAHRGASGYLPEHTLEAKALAFGQGADYLEQDVVMTKDNQLIVLHGLVLDNVTDVATKFPDRKRDDGKFYAIDFTLAEIRTLAVTNWFMYKEGKKVAGFKGRFPIFKSAFKIHTLAEEIEFIQGLNFSTGKNIGIFPEIKAPWFHRKEGKDISVAVIKLLKKYGYTSRNDKIYLQCFDANELQRIKNEINPKLNVTIKLDQLIAYNDWNETQQLMNGKWVNYNYDWMSTPQGMEKIATYADAISPDYHMIISNTNKKIVISPVVARAHRAGMKVIPFSVLADRLPDYVSNVDDLYRLLYTKAGVDGVFTDFPDLATNFLTKSVDKKINPSSNS